MKKIMAALLVAALLAALCALPAFAEDWTVAYSRVLAQMKTDDPNPLRNECYLYDINGDTIPELLIPTGTCEADSALRIYTMRNGAAAWIATLGFSHSVACGLSGENAMLIQQAHQGWEQGRRVTMQNGSVQEQILYESNTLVTDYTPYAALPTYARADMTGMIWTAQPRDNNAALLEAAIEKYGGGSAPFVPTVESTCSQVIGTVKVKISGNGFVRSYPRPDETAGLLRHVYNGSYPCVGTYGDWYIILCDGFMGYVRAASGVSFSTDGAHAYNVSATGMVTVNTQDQVNVRAQADKNADLLMSVCPGATFLCVGQDRATKWYQILLPTGQYGYVSNKLVTYSELSVG